MSPEIENNIGELRAELNRGYDIVNRLQSENRREVRILHQYWNLMDLDVKSFINRVERFRIPDTIISNHSEDIKRIIQKSLKPFSDVEHVKFSYYGLESLQKLDDTIDKINNYLIKLHLMISEDREVISIPGEYTAPIKVIVKDNRIEAVSHKHHLGPLSEKSVENIRNAVSQILERLIQSLSDISINSDQRLLPIMKTLFNEINVPLREMSVEAIGINWQLSCDVIEVTGETFPDALLVQINRVLSTIENMLSQYDEWHLYKAQELANSIKISSLPMIINNGKDIARFIENETSVIDQIISHRLSYITESFSSNIVRRETLVAPLVGSISNIIAAAANVALEKAPIIIHEIKTLTDTASAFVGTASQIFGGSLMLLATCITMIKKFAPALSKYPVFKWLENVHKAVLRYEAQIKEFLPKKDNH